VPQDEGRAARVIDISDLVRLRKHFSWCSQTMLLVCVACLGHAGSGVDQDLNDVPLMIVIGGLAAATSTVLYTGRASALAWLAFPLAFASSAATIHFFVVSRPLSRPELGTVIGGAAVAVASLYPIWIVRRPFYRSTLRSPWLPLMYASGRRLGATYAGGALSWKAWAKQFSPWAVVVAVLTYVITVVLIVLLKKGAKDYRGMQRSVQNTIFSIGGMLFVWTKRKTAMRGSERRAIDRRSPILFLRSFDDDMMKMESAGSSSKANLGRRGLTFEQIIENNLSAFGPFVAIGRPQETLAPLGAARDYVPDEHWQDEVERRMTEASIIVLIIGTSRGLAWELGHVRDLEQLHKLIVVFPPTDDVATRWKAVRNDDLATSRPMLPDTVRPDRTLALIYADDLTPILIEGDNDERSYETALRLGGILAITTGAEPAYQVSGK
jgi:hypothetical protein